MVVIRWACMWCDGLGVIRCADDDYSHIFVVRTKNILYELVMILTLETHDYSLKNYKDSKAIFKPSYRDT